MNGSPTFQLPPQMSTAASRVDDLYYFLYWLSVVLFVGIIAAATYFAIKYKRRKGVQAEPTGHNLLLETAWTIAPIFILVLLFHWGFKAWLFQAVAPADSMEIRVRGFQWGWDFEYPNGAHSGDLKVPVHKPVKLIMSSNDVIHSFYVPEFRIKKDLVPGMYTTTWFEATQLGDANVFCAEYCGGRGEGDQAKGHWAMKTQVKIMPQDEFQKWLDEGMGPRPGETVADWGKRLSGEKACLGCHSVDGSKMAGPTWKGLWAKDETLASGTAHVDENYLRESMLEPQAKIVAGYPPVMPTFKGILNDKEIDAIIGYIKTVK